VSLKQLQSLKQLRHMFPHHDENLLENALVVASGCVEVALSYVLESFGQGGNKSPQFEPIRQPFGADFVCSSTMHAHNIDVSDDDSEDNIPLSVLMKTVPSPRSLTVNATSMRFARRSVIRCRRGSNARVINKTSSRGSVVSKRHVLSHRAEPTKRPRGNTSSDRDHRVVFFPERFHRGSLNKLWRAIRKAKISLDVSVQYLSHMKLKKGLLEACRHGVRVRVIVDAGRDRSLDIPGRSELIRAGIEVRIDRTSRTMHHKFAVIDKTLVINGSLNWTNAVYQNMESVVISRSPSLADAFSEEFNHLWCAVVAQAPLPPKKARFSANSCEVLFFPDAAKQNLQSFIAELRTTKHTLDVCVFSLWLGEAVETLCELQRRGVIVRVVSDKRHAANHGGRLARRELQKIGIEYLVDKLCGEMHHKFAVIDGETVVCGSLNWSQAAVAGNIENMVFYRSMPSLASKFHEEFESLRRMCRRPKSKVP